MAMTIDPETGRFVPISFAGPGFSEAQAAVGGMAFGRIGPRPGQMIPLQQEPVGVPNFNMFALPQATPAQVDLSTGLPVQQGPAFLSQQQQRQRGARAGTLGVRQGPVFGGKPAFSPFARAALRPGMSLSNQIRALMGGRFGSRPTPTPGRPLSFGLLGQQGPASGGRFGFQGKPFGRLGQRGR